MIQSFADAATEDLFNGVNSKEARGFDKRLWTIIARKLDMVNAATALSDLKVPPGNQLHALDKDQAGRHAIRINDQYRITFRFENGHSHKVRCEDYH